MIKKFQELKSESIEEAQKKNLRGKIISNLENADFSPFKGLEAELKVTDSSKSFGYYASYEIFNESRNVHWKKDPTSEAQGTYSPSTDMSNVEKWSYMIAPKDQFITHSVNHDIVDSKHVKTCYSCNGAREIDCSTCKGNGKCGSCSGRGDIACSCGNGNCPECNGEGKIKCTNNSCGGGKCTECSGLGKNKCYYCEGKGKRYELATDRYYSCERCHNKGEIQCSRCYGKGVCSSCNGNGAIQCRDCNGDKKHRKCNGTGKIECVVCRGTGYCGGCNGKGKVTCDTCNGRGNLLHYLSVTAQYVNSLESKQLLANIDSFNTIKIDEIAVDTEVNKEITEKEFNQDSIGKVADIRDINDYLQTRKSSSSESHILQERIKIICVPVFTVNYTLNNKEYTSYFVGEKEQHFYKNSPLKDYNEAVDDQIASLIKETNLPDAITLLEEQVSRYESLEDPENVKRCTDLISDLKIGLQKDLMKGGFFTQILFVLLDLIAIYTLVSICGLLNESNLIFLGLALPLLLIRIGYYFKHLVPLKLFSDIDNAELNKYFNGDKDYSYYMFDTPILQIFRTLGIIGFIGFFIFSIPGESDLITQEMSIAYTIYTLLFGITLVTTILLDLGVNRKIKKVLNIKTQQFRMLRTISINTTICAFIGIVVLLIAGIFVGDKPSADLYAVGSVADGLTTISYYFYSLLILGVISYLISGGQAKQLKRLKVNESHKAGFFNIIIKNKKKLKLAAIFLCALFVVILSYYYGMEFYEEKQIQNKWEKKKIEYYQAIKNGDAELEEGNMKSASNYYSLAKNINNQYQVDENWNADKKSLILDSLVEAQQKAIEEARILAEEQKRIKELLLLDTLSDSLTNIMFGAIGDYKITLELNLTRIYVDSLKTFDFNIDGNYFYTNNGNSRIELTGIFNTQTNRMQINSLGDIGNETFDGEFYNDSIYSGNWSKKRKDGNTDFNFQVSASRIIRNN